MTINSFEESAVKAGIREWMFDLALKSRPDLKVIFTLPASHANCARLFKQHIPDSIIYGAEMDAMTSKSDYTGIMYRDRVENCSVEDYIQRHVKDKRLPIDFINLDYCGGVGKSDIAVAKKIGRISSRRAVIAVTHTVLMDGVKTATYDHAASVARTYGLQSGNLDPDGISSLYCQLYEATMGATLIGKKIYQNPHSSATMMCGVFQRNV